jgi:magnesium-protoporphyrin O-methyltransferase
VSSSCCALESKFDASVADADLRRYHRRGPQPTSRRMIALLRARIGATGTLLDIGGGVGVLEHEMVPSTFSSATLVEASPAYLEAARKEAERRGTAERLRFLHGDFAAMAQSLHAADAVAMDRVVCCYPDHRALMSGAIAKARSHIALSYPRDSWPVKVVIATQNLIRRLTGNPFRTYAHPVTELARLLGEGGFTRVGSHRGVVWIVEVYARDATSGGQLAA